MEKMNLLDFENLMKAQGVQFDASDILDFSKARDKIVPRLIGRDGNQDILSDRPYKETDGLVCTYYVMLKDGNGMDAMISAPITNQLMDSYGISADDLHGIAMQNMETLMPAGLMSLSEVVARMNLGFDFDLGAVADTDQFQNSIENNEAMYVLSNKQQTYGACEIMNPQLMDKLQKNIGDFYIIPSCVHETILVPKSFGFELAELESMVRDVNATEVVPEEQLSDHVYAYDAETKEIYRADHELQHQKQKEAEKEKNKDPEHDTRNSIKSRLAEKQKEVEKVAHIPAVAASKAREACLG